MEDILTLNIPEDISEKIPNLVSIIKASIEKCDFSLSIILKMPQNLQVLKIYTLLL